MFVPPMTTSTKTEPPTLLLQPTLLVIHTTHLVMAPSDFA
jgi:hypothetical protein